MAIARRAREREDIMAVIKTKTHKAHDDACASAESFRQSAVRAPGVSQATVRTAEIVYYRALVVSAMVNGLPSAQFYATLRDLGTGGA
jgi:hypothetical protein